MTIVLTDGQNLDSVTSIIYKKTRDDTGALLAAPIYDPVGNTCNGRDADCIKNLIDAKLK